MECAKTTENWSARWPSYSTSGNIPEGNKTWVCKYDLQTYFHRYTFHNSKDMETTLMPIERRMDKESVVYVATPHNITISLEIMKFYDL